MGLLGSLEASRDKFRYECSFKGKQKFAIGIKYPITHIVESDVPLSDEEVALKLYDTHQSIDGGIAGVRIKKLYHCTYHNCQDRSKTLCALCYE